MTHKIRRLLLACLLPCLHVPLAQAFMGSFRAFNDSQCTHPAIINHDGVPINNSMLPITLPLSDWEHGAGTAFTNLTFDGVRSAGVLLQDSGSINVYWHVTAPPPGCQFVMFRASTLGWKIMTRLPGYLMLRTSLPGCYFSALVPQESVVTSYCCGRGCDDVDMDFVGKNGTVADVKTGSFMSKNPLNTNMPTNTAVSSAKVDKRSEPLGTELAKRSESTVEARTDTKLTKRSPSFYYIPDPFDKKVNNVTCKIMDQRGPDRNLGQQVAVTSPQACDGGFSECSFAIQFMYQRSTSLSFNKMYSFDVNKGSQFGTTVPLETSYVHNFGPSASLYITQAWTNMTTTEVANATTDSTIQTVFQQIGTVAFISFTPFYDCWTGNVNCTDGRAWEYVPKISFCQPQVNNAGHLAGIYSVVYISQD